MREGINLHENICEKIRKIIPKSKTKLLHLVSLLIKGVHNYGKIVQKNRLGFCENIQINAVTLYACLLGELGLCTLYYMYCSVLYVSV